MNSFKLNEKLYSEEYKSLKESIKNNVPWNKNNDKYIVKPFSVGVINDFVDLSDCDYMRIVDTLLNVKINNKSNDLYKFQQSKDFKNIKNKLTTAIRSFFIQQVLPWMKEASEIDLFDNEIDITYSIYKDTDYLLCHDDHLDARRIAFIWYLVDENWSELDGGQLDLIEADSNGEPASIVHSVQPRKNTFAFFKVAENSYHHVREVIRQHEGVRDARISINGWFRGPSLEWQPPRPIPGIPRLRPSEIEEELVYGWINNLYLQDQVSESIRDNFIQSSEVQIPDFLNAPKLMELETALSRMEFCLCGEMNVRQVFLTSSEYPEPVRELKRLLSSEAIMVLLSDFTNLSLHSASAAVRQQQEEEPVVEAKRPRLDPEVATETEEIMKVGECSEAELRCWKKGCYSLLRDGDLRQKSNRLELLISVGWPKSEEQKEEEANGDEKMDHAEEEEVLESGGFYSYLAEGEDEELLTVVPSHNALSLVYADHSTMGFMKYITHNHKMPTGGCFDFFATFYEYQ